MSESRRRWPIATLAVGVLVAMLSMPASASAICGTVIFDYVPGLHAIDCGGDGGGEESWTVPAQITKPRFEVRGADDQIGGAGGFVKATLSLKAGDVLTLQWGADGAATTVSRGGELLLVAGGGDGAEPNFVTPEAEAVEAEAPGGSPGPTIGDGSIYVEWYDAREPFDLEEPLPPNPVEYPGSQVEIFSHTGAWQVWTPPEGINRAAFELYGGAGTSGEPYGHVVASYSVTPEDSFSLFVGGPGGDTSMYPGGWDAALASGGDTERPNYLPFSGFSKAEFWEGGGPGSVAGEGKALVYYWREPEMGPPAPPGPAPIPPPVTAEVCVVPKLANRTPRSARKVLAQASCGPVKVSRRSARTRMRGRVIRQRPAPGTVIPATKAVRLIVGR